MPLAAAAETTPARRSFLPILFLAVIILFVSSARLRMLSTPLDRDEGECAYAGQLILDGHPPYLYAYNMKLPGTYYAYAGIMSILGQTPEGIHFGLLLVNVVSIILVFFLGRALSGDFAAIVSAAFFALLTLDDPGVNGYHALLEHFVLLFALAGALCLLPGKRSPVRIAVAGAFMGVAYVMKQHGAVFLLFGLAVLVLENFQGSRQYKKLIAKSAVFLAAAALPFVVVCLLMRKQGVFGNFWFWTFGYAREYAAETHLGDAWTYFSLNAPDVFGHTCAIWIVIACSITYLALRGTGNAHRAWIFVFLICSILAIFPGFYFRAHYFILIFPAAALAAGAGLAAWRTRLEHHSFRLDPAWSYKGGRQHHLLGKAPTIEGHWLPVAVAILSMATFLVTERASLFTNSPRLEARQVYGGNPLPEAVEIGLYLRAHGDPQDRVVVFGSEPEIFFYAHRKSASGYIYMYGMTEAQKYSTIMQQQFRSDIEAARPRYAVLVNVYSSWWILRAREGSMAGIQQWVQPFLRNYRVVGVFNIMSKQETDVYWGTRPAPPAPYSVVLFERM